MTQLNFDLNMEIELELDSAVINFGSEHLVV